MRNLLIFVLSCAAATAQPANEFREAPATTRAEAAWKASLVALAAASAVDAHSSWGKCCESNPLLASDDRRFGSKAVLWKAGAVGMQALVQTRMVRSRPALAKFFTVVNLGTAGLFTGVAVHNYGIRR